MMCLLLDHKDNAMFHRIYARYEEESLERIEKAALLVPDHETKVLQFFRDGWRFLLAGSAEGGMNYKFIKELHTSLLIFPK